MSKSPAALNKDAIQTIVDSITKVVDLKQKKLETSVMSRVDKKMTDPIGTVYWTVNTSDPSPKMGGVWESLGSFVVGTTTVYAWVKES